MPRFKDQDNLFNKIADLIKHEETGVTFGVLNKNRRLLQKNSRPYTSLSNRNRMSFDANALGKYQVVLDLTPKEEVQELEDPSKVSTSRALMNYSKVYRNSSGDRFKVKREKPYYNHFALISAQKVVFQEKEKKERREVEKAIEKPKRQRRFFKP
jgi:hypothetical protein